MTLLAIKHAAVSTMTTKPGWTPESQIEPATVSFVHSCLKVSRDTRLTVDCVIELTAQLKCWVHKEWEQKQKGTSMSLADLCVPGAISALAAAVEQLDSLENSLPHGLRRDWGVIKDGARIPHPEINTWELPQATEIQNLLMQIQNAFEFILRIMNLLSNAVKPSFWEEVSRAQGVATKSNRRQLSTDQVLAHWQNTEQHLRSSVTDIQSFVTDTQTPTVAESPAAVHSDTLHPQAQFTALIQRLRQCSV
jgi:hypothetical protein